MKSFHFIQRVLLSRMFQVVLLAAICVVLAIQAFAQDEIANFIIFKTTSQRFLSQANLYDYIEYNIIFDKFFYAPQFALFFMPFAFLPLKISVFLWLLLGALLLYFAIQKLPLDNGQKTVFFYIILIDLVNSLQNLQTNAINAAFMLLILVYLSEGKPVFSALCIAICISIKIYPAMAGLLFLFYPKKMNLWLGSAIFILLFFLLPLVFIPREYFISSLQTWTSTVLEDANDKFIGNSPSLVGINYTWLGRPFNHFYIQATGLALTFLPLLKLFRKKHGVHFSLLYLAFIMLFVVIFNHATESPTYIIATCGAAIWYVISPKDRLNNMLFIILFIGCILTPTDLYPAWLRKEIFIPYKVRVIPCLLIWLKIFYELMTYKGAPYENTEQSAVL
jgi:hypothetical protein